MGLGTIAFVDNGVYICGMAIIVENKFEFGDIVYLKTDREQNPRIVYMMKVFPNETLYELACGTTVSSHYEFEISKEVNVLMQTTN